MANDLQLPLTGGAMTAKTALDAISPSLVHLLMVTASSASEAVQLAGRHPALVQEARDATALVQRLAGPAGTAAVLRAMSPLLLHFDPRHFGAGKKGEMLADAFEASFAEALSDLPLEAIEIAVAEWIKVGKWFPKVAELRELAEPKAKEIRTMAWRLRQVAEKARLPKPPITPEERAEIQRQTAALVADLKSGAVFKGRPGGINAPPLRSRAEVAAGLRAMA